MLDFENIMKDRNIWRDGEWHQTKHQYTFPTGSVIEFMSVDTYGKAHGPRRDVLFINECNNLDYKIVDQLVIRTKEWVWLDWNPTSEFWFYTDMQPNRDDIDFITLTYKDNEALDQTTINEIESHRHNKSWWRVYGEGQLGELEGKIFTNWVMLGSLPHEARLVRRGLDFGYTNDPTALVDVYYYNGGFILDERIYRKGLTNKQIADYINNAEYPETLVIADSAEPKSIDELASYGINIMGAKKGQGSVNQGIQYVQDQRISVTSRSTNIIKEYRNYMYKVDKNDKILNEPEDMYNHTMDAIRYGLDGYINVRPKEVGAVPMNGPEPELEKGYFANESGELEAFHINVGDMLKKQQADNRPWMYR